MEKYQWNLNYLLKDDNEFEERLKELKALCDKIASYKGKLGEEQSFKEYFMLQLELENKLGPVYMYAHLGSDLDKKDMAKAAMLQKVMMMFNNFSISTSFEQPELIQVGEEKVMKFIDSNKEIEEYRFYLKDLFRKQKHVLNFNEEELLSTVNPAMSKGRDLYSALSVADGRPQEIKLDGKKVNVTQGNWSSLVMDAKSEKDRKKIFEALYKYYDEHKNTYATIYEGILQANKAYAKVKKFDSIL